MNATQMDPIPFPFVPGGIDWAVTFSPPVIDLHPETPPAPPPEITLGPGQFTLHTGVQMCIACVFARGRGDDGQTPDKTRRRLDGVRHATRRASSSRCARSATSSSSRARPGRLRSGCAWTRSRSSTSPRTTSSRSSSACCAWCSTPRSTQMELPLEALRAGAFSLTLVRGPEIEDDQVKVYGEV